MSTVALSDLLAQLDLERLEDDLFRGQSTDLGGISVFGGQVLGQALVAAQRTVTDRMCHSLHAYFLRPGDMRAPIIYEVDRIRDGRSFTTRSVHAIQHGRPIFVMSASFQAIEDGLEHQMPMPNALSPETLKSERELRSQLAERVPAPLRKLIDRDLGIEMRPVNPVDFFAPEKRAPENKVWIRSAGELPDDPCLHQALLAYASDFNFMGTSLLPHGITFMQGNLQGASLDHAMWFHRPFRMDQWLLYVMDSPSAAAARGFNRGSVYAQDGTLIASCAQEGLIRVRAG